MKDDKLAQKIQELPETRILQLEGEILNLKREIAGLEGYRRDYQSVCMELDLFRGDGKYLHSISSKLLYILKRETKMYFKYLLLAGKKIPSKQKRTRNKTIKILRKAQKKYSQIIDEQMDELYEWKNTIFYKFD